MVTFLLATGSWRESDIEAINCDEYLERMSDVCSCCSQKLPVVDRNEHYKEAGRKAAEWVFKNTPGGFCDGFREAWQAELERYDNS